MDIIPNDHVYSYSQLSSVDECPYSFYLERIEKDENGRPLQQQSNFFSEHGTAVHKVLEKWADGEVSLEDLPEEYKNLYPRYVTTSPPAYMSAYRSKAYDQGMEYFEHFDGFAGYTVVSAEQRFLMELKLPSGKSRQFTGCVDLILRSDETGELVIVDHKSKSYKEFKKVRDEMYRQQYLYAAFVKERYGEYPSVLMFNLFKEPGLLDTKPFSVEEYNGVLAWAEERIDEIEDRDLFTWLEAKPEPDFFCNEICSVRKYCPNGVLKPEPKTKRAKVKKE